MSIADTFAGLESPLSFVAFENQAKYYYFYRLDALIINIFSAECKPLFTRIMTVRTDCLQLLHP
jgi:hypothetical protein